MDKILEFYERYLPDSLDNAKNDFARAYDNIFLFVHNSNISIEEKNLLFSYFFNNKNEEFYNAIDDAVIKAMNNENKKELEDFEAPLFEGLDLSTLELEKDNNRRRNNMNFKDVFNEKFYNELVKCNFVKDMEEILNNNSLINIDIDDFKALEDGEIVGTISQVFTDYNADYNINIISEKMPTRAILYINGSNELSLKTVDLFVKKLRDNYDDINMIFGTNADDSYVDEVKVQALLVA